MYKFKSEDGIPGALIIWAVFVLVFALLGVPAALCIFLGAFAGAAVGVLLAFWRAEKLDDVPKEETTSPIKSTRRFPLFGLGKRIPLLLQPKSPESLRRNTRSGKAPAIEQKHSSTAFKDAVQRRKRS